MKMFKMFFIGIMFGFGVGVWLGVNIGKGNKIYANPFAEENIQEKLKQKVGESIEKLGEGIKGTINN